MNSSTSWLIAVLLVFSSAPSAPVTAEEPDPVPGFKDTPLVPGTTWHKHDPDRPQPPVVRAPAGAPPSDAIILFDGSGIDAFEPSGWFVREGLLVAGNGPLSTRQSFGDFQLHLEWRGPIEDMENWGDQGNNGVFPMGLYEIQIFDSHGTPIYADGHSGAIYGETPPLVNPTRPRGEWQTYDIIWTAPVFDGETVVSPPYVTVLFNGVVVQNHQAVLGRVAYRKVVPLTPHPQRLPLKFGAHGCPVEFRNIWIRELNPR